MEYTREKEEEIRQKLRKGLCTNSTRFLEIVRMETDQELLRRITKDREERVRNGYY